MKNFRQIPLLPILTGVVRLAAIFLLVCAGLFFLELRQTTKEVKAETVAVQKLTADADAAVLDVQSRLKDISQNVNAALIQVGLATDETRLASIEQREYWGKVSKETILAVKDARALIQASTAGVNQTSQDLHGVVTTAQLDLVTLDSTLQSLDSAVRDADRNFASNPDAARALKSLADSAEEINRTTADVRDRVHALTHPKPQRWFMSLAKGLLDFGYKMKAFF